MSEVTKFEAEPGMRWHSEATTMVLLSDYEKLQAELAECRGLKDHEIANLVNAVTAALNGSIDGLPQCLRGLISGAVVDELMNHNLRIDKH